MTAATKINLDELTTSVFALFPTLNSTEQRLSLELYRLLAVGQPVPREALAERVGLAVETVNPILENWPAVFSDSQQRVVGYWGLSIPEAYASPHRLTINGRLLSAWRAWDTLFLPQLLGQTAEVESTSPTAGVTVRLTVTPDALERVDPAGAQMSLLLPDKANQKNVVNAFCCFVHFFPSHGAGESWAAQHPGTFLLPVEEAYALARRKNKAVYAEVLP
jgi:alkylmercury lyase